MNADKVLLEVKNKVAILTLNRPQAFNALDRELLQNLCTHLQQLDQNSKINCILLWGGEQAFAAGVDIKEMALLEYPQTYIDNDFQSYWHTLRSIRKPIIAAIAGYAYGGGCELAMSCDLIIAADNAQFAQPEIRLGILPGAGATQRLPRAISKAKAMDMCLTARVLNAQEAEQAGLISSVVPQAQLREFALGKAETIAGYSLPVVLMIKEAINYAFETGLHSGLQFEQILFHALFATADQKEGMEAFLKKRQPCFKNG